MNPARAKPNSIVAIFLRALSSSGSAATDKPNILVIWGDDWLIDHIFFLVPAQVYVGKFLITFKEFPPRQKAASFSIDQLMNKLQTTTGSP